VIFREVLLKSPNWLFGSKNQDHPASVVPSSVEDSAPVKSADELEQELVGIDWQSLYSPVAEEELYDKYKIKSYITLVNILSNDIFAEILSL